MCLVIFVVGHSGRRPPLILSTELIIVLICFTGLLLNLVGLSYIVAKDTPSVFLYEYIYFCGASSCAHVMNI